MAVMEKISSLFIVAFLVASGVEAQSDITYETCQTGTGALTSEGNKITTCKRDKLSPKYQTRNLEYHSIVIMFKGLISHIFCFHIRLFINYLN